MSSDSFYGQVLTEHYLHPQYRGQLPHADVTQSGVNPSCGDSLQLQVRFTGDVIEAISFDGAGCAISQAAADIVCALVVGKTKSQAQQLVDLLEKLACTPLTPAQQEQLGEAVELTGALAMPLRVKCALLAARTLRELLDE